MVPFCLRRNPSATHYDRHRMFTKVPVCLILMRSETYLMEIVIVLQETLLSGWKNST